VRVLIKTYGYFGDILFASSIAKSLKTHTQYGVTHVDFLIGFPQLHELMSNNPYIDRVWVSDHPNPMPHNSILDESQYDRMYQLGQLSFSLPPPEEFQRLIGIVNPRKNFEVYTTKANDELVQAEFALIREKLDPSQKIIYIPYNWDAKAFRYTEDEYEAGRYQRPRDAEIQTRSIDKIVDSLSQYHYVVFGGLPYGNSQIGVESLQKSLALEASIIKYADWYVGPESGLCNIAGGVGTKTIINWDWVHHLYGPKGIIKQCDPPMLGPANMFGADKHWVIDPYVTDEELFQNIVGIIKNN